MSADSEALRTLLDLHAERRALLAQIERAEIEKDALLDLVRDLKSGKRRLKSVVVGADGSIDV